MLLPVVLIGSLSGYSQFKKSVKTKHTTSTHQTVSKFVERNYSSPASISEVKDIQESDNSYLSVKNLLETNKIILAYDDNTFKSNEPLRRGDFIVSLNSALDVLNKMKTDMGVDSSVINTLDRNRKGSYLTSVSQVKDLNANSVYYPAAKSLIETWGISEPFLNNKTLSADKLITEKEVYNILHNSLGYTSTAFNPYATSITRGKFAIALNNAVLQKSDEIASLHSQAYEKAYVARKANEAIMAQQEKMRKDSTARANEAIRVATANAEIAAKSKTKHKK
ncbi:MAG: hypothetical protein NVSMB45_05610 [Ginsengibacter sp.]